MGIEVGTAMLIGSALMAGTTVASSMMQPGVGDMTNYDLLRQTQEQANAESDAARARIEEARKREELRQQALAGRDILTSDTGVASGLTVRNQVLGEEDAR